MKEELLKKIYKKNIFIISILIIFFAHFYYDPVMLGWWDTKVSNYYDIYVKTNKNRELKLNRNFFTPFDISFAQNRFYYLDNNKKLNVNTYGSSSSYNTFKSLENGNYKYISNNLYNYKKKIVFEDYLNTFFKHYNYIQDNNIYFFFKIMSAPYHIYTQTKNFLSVNEKIIEYKVVYNQTYFNGVEIIYLKKDIILKHLVEK